MSDTPARLPQVGETWRSPSGNDYTLLAVDGENGWWKTQDAYLTQRLGYSFGYWTPPEPPIEWERWLDPNGWSAHYPIRDGSWHIVKREGQEPTIERVDP